MTTSAKQTSLFGEETSTSFPVDSHVSPIQWQGSEKAQRILDISGRKCLEQFESAGRPGLWARTFLGLLIGQEGWFSSRCALTWKVKGTKYNRLYCQLQVSTLRTGEIGFGLLPTVTTQEPETITTELTESGRRLTKDGKNSHSLNLGRLIANQNGLSTNGQPKFSHHLLKTPTGMDGEVTSGKKNPVSGDSGTLAQEIMSGYEPTMQKLGMLPTPTKSDFVDRRKSENWNGSDLVSTITEITEQTGQTGQLSPHFVMEMMGFPPEHTMRPFMKQTTWIEIT